MLTLSRSSIFDLPDEENYIVRVRSRSVSCAASSSTAGSIANVENERGTNLSAGPYRNASFHLVPSSTQNV